jgi:hypothetical protein
MAEFDVEAFVARLERMGLKLTSVPLADGKVRINRWRMMNASEHTQQIQDLWTSQIGDNQARIDVLAAHLGRTAPAVTANRIGADRAGTGSQAVPPSPATIVPQAAAPQRPGAQTAAPPHAPAIVQTPASIAKVGAPQRAASPQKALDKLVGIQKLPGVQAVPGAQKFPGLQAASGPQRLAGMRTSAATPMPATTPAATGVPKPLGPQPVAGAPKALRPQPVAGTSKPSNPQAPP